MVDHERVAIRMSADLRDTLNKLATHNCRSPSDIVREAILLYQQVNAGRTDNDRRRQFLHEFLFLVVDKYLA